MNSILSPFSNISSHVQDILTMYLVPIGVAVVIAITIVLFGLGRGKSSAGAETIPADMDNERSPEPDTVPAPAADATPDDGKLAILIVDDSAVARAKLGKLFQANGYHVVVANDGLQALEKLSATFFSVLITDLEMPNMNGLELIASVQGSLETEDLPIIAITGHDELQARVHEYQGLYGIFKKPWHDRELLKRVETLAQLRQSPANAPRRRKSDIHA
ncbi:response regulator [Undibacterium sp. TJN25]|uniref:response regulator n=1 Tax=Undibacterium sp. TJN25 TaxID=3413056 RepID=UPI003BF08E12